MSGSTGVSSSGLGINSAALISALAPIFLGSGKTTQVQGPQTATTSGTTSGTTSSSFDPAALAALTSIAGQATSNANNPAATSDLVNNILTESAQQFAPVIAQQNSSGLYNTSTLAGLQGEARARATAAASQAVLNYQTSQQQVATNALNTVASNTKSTATTGTTDQTTQTAPVTTTSFKAPTIDPMTTLLGLGASFLGNKLLQSGPVSGALDSAGNFLSGAGTSLTDALGLTTPLSTTMAQSASVGPGFFADASGAPSTAAAPVSSITTQADLDISAAPSVAFDTSSASAAGDAASAAAANAGFDASASIGADAAAGAAEAGGTSFSDLAAGLGGGAAAGGAADAGLIAAAAGGSDAALAGAGAFGGSIGAEAASSAIAGGAAADAAGAAGFGIADALPAIAAVVGWIICTELREQGKMSATLYRYGLRKYLSYPEWGRYGYLLWARPTVRHMRRYPNGLVTTFMCWLFVLRINNIAAKEGCSIARWTYRGLIVSLAVELLSATLGLLLLPLRATVLRTYNWSI